MLKDLEIIDNLLYYKNRLYIPNSNTIHTWIAQSEHDSKIAGHFGQEKTIELISRNFFWPKIIEWLSIMCDHVQNASRISPQDILNMG